MFILASMSYHLYVNDHHY